MANGALRQAIGLAFLRLLTSWLIVTIESVLYFLTILFVLGLSWQSESSSALPDFAFYTFCAVVPALAVLTLWKLIVRQGSSIVATLIAACLGTSGSVFLLRRLSNQYFIRGVDSISLAPIAVWLVVFAALTWRTSRSRAELPFSQTKWVDAAALLLAIAAATAVGFPLYSQARNPHFREMRNYIDGKAQQPKSNPRRSNSP